MAPKSNLIAANTVTNVATGHDDGTLSTLNGAFLEEYSTADSIRRYTRETAGSGITYLLEHDYGRIYLDVIEKCMSQSRRRKGIRLWEFGCGGGMNLLHIVALLERRRIPLDCAIGTDFSQPLIDAANHEAEQQLSPEQRKKVRFCVARHEDLVGETTHALGIERDALLGSFDVMIGVNTIRYCHRLAKADECVRAVSDLLTDSGVCIVIDMNDRFPAFRSRFRDRLEKDATAYYLPSLEEYARPFSSAGFEIVEKKTFCWIPHSAGPVLTAVMRTAAPILSTVAPSRAMRSLVIASKTAGRH